MKKTAILSFLLLSFTIFLTTSCFKDDDTVPIIPKAGLRMVNAFTDAPSIYFTVDGQYLTNPYLPINYREYTQNLVFLYPGNRALKVFNNGNNLISDTTLNLRDSVYYTSFIFGTSTNTFNLITEDKSISNLSDKSAVRFLHLANNLANVNVYLDNIGNDLYTDRAPETISTQNVANIEVFSQQDPGNRKIIITDLNDVVLIEREYRFVKEGYYSIILIGDHNSTDTPLYLGVVQQ